jgi:4-hydroxyphenylpyruvate dioxygenase
MRQIAKSDMTTGNKDYVSFVLQSNDIKFVITAPYGIPCDNAGSDMPHPAFDKAHAHKFVSDHGLAVRAMGIQVADAREAFTVSTANGAVPVLAPVELTDAASGQSMWLSEVKMVGDVVMRFVSGTYSGGYIYHSMIYL